MDKYTGKRLDGRYEIHGCDHSGCVGYYTFKVQNIMGGLCNEGSSY